MESAEAMAPPRGGRDETFADYLAKSGVSPSMGSHEMAPAPPPATPLRESPPVAPFVSDIPPSSSAPLEQTRNSPTPETDNDQAKGPLTKMELRAEAMAAAAANRGAPAGPRTVERVAISWSGSGPPADAFPGSVALLGVFTKLDQMINGHPCYVNEAQPNVMLWFSPNRYWSIGTKDNLGTGISGVHSTERDCPLPERIRGPWHISDRRNQGWLNTENVQITNLSPDSSDSFGSPLPSRAATSPAAKNAPRQDLEGRVSNARRMCEEATDARYRELMNGAFEDYTNDRINEDDLQWRKQEARHQAEAGLEGLEILDEAYVAYAAATAARQAVEQALVEALKAEDDAADRMEEALRDIEEGRATSPRAGAVRNARRPAPTEQRARASQYTSNLMDAPPPMRPLERAMRPTERAMRPTERAMRAPERQSPYEERRARRQTAERGVTSFFNDRRTDDPLIIR